MKPIGINMGWDWLDIKSYKKRGKNCASCRSARKLAKRYIRICKRHNRFTALQKAAEEA